MLLSNLSPYRACQECARLQEELQSLRRDNVSLDSGLHEREKTLSHLTTRVAVLEQELKDKEQVTVCCVVCTPLI